MSFNYLFNSYYEQIGQRHARNMRGLLTRPSLDEVKAYRTHVDNAMENYLKSNLCSQEIARVELGLNHEEQHQELILTDIKYTLNCNPMKPIYFPPKLREASPKHELFWLTFEGGLIDIGSGNKTFIFDCEGPSHKEWLEPYALASRPITNGEYLKLINDGGYKRAELWLSDGWRQCQEENWESPL